MKSLSEIDNNEEPYSKEKALSILVGDMMWGIKEPEDSEFYNNLFSYEMSKKYLAKVTSYVESKPIREININKKITTNHRESPLL